MEWGRFRRGQLAVWCRNAELFNSFMRACEDRGYTWLGGERATGYDMSEDISRGDSVIVVQDGKLACSFFKCVEDDKAIFDWGYSEIIIDSPLYITEVMQNIERGQTYANSVREIICRENGDIYMRNTNGVHSDLFVFRKEDKDMYFTLIGKAYNFSGAYEKCKGTNKAMISRETGKIYRVLKEKLYIVSNGYVSLCSTISCKELLKDWLVK